MLVLYFYKTFLVGPIDKIPLALDISSIPLQVLVLEGITEETGNSVQVRTSYLPNEILWGHRFSAEPVTYDGAAGVFHVQHNVSRTEADPETPRLSAKQLDSRRK